MDHIFNLSAIKRRMTDKPKAQRLQNFVNDEDWGALSYEQQVELVEIVRRGYSSFMKQVKAGSKWSL